MNTSFWGSRAWDFLFCVAMNYRLDINCNRKLSEENRLYREHYIEFFKSLQWILPCSYCRVSYSVFYRTVPITCYLTNNRQLMYWVYLLKCLVNDKLRLQGVRKPKEPSFESVYNKYLKHKSNGKKKKKRVGH
jgi:hypothetical protein